MDTLSGIYSIGRFFLRMWKGIVRISSTHAGTSFDADGIISWSEDAYADRVQTITTNEDEVETTPFWEKEELFCYNLSLYTAWWIRFKH